MTQLHIGHRGAVRRDRVRRGTRDHLQPVAVPCIFEGGHVTLGRARPCHRPAGSVGALAHRLPARAVGQQSCYFIAGLYRVTKGNENAAAVGQQLARMPVRR